MMDDLHATLEGGENFTKDNLAHAYEQLVPDDDSSDLIMHNAWWVLLQYMRLTFSISTATTKLQKTKRNVLKSITKVSV